MSLSSRVISGASWSIAGKLITQVMQLAFSVFIMRLLTPEDFGLIVMVGVLTGFADIFVDLGFGQALIQKKKLNEEQCSSVFWLNVIVGILLTLVFSLFAPLIAELYEKEVLVVIVYALSVKFLINAMSVVPSSLFQRNIDFKTIVKIDIFSMLMSGCLAISLAILGYGVWSLVFQILSRSFFRVFFLWISSTWRPSFLLSWSVIKDLSNFGLSLSGFNIVNYWARGWARICRQERWMIF